MNLTLIDLSSLIHPIHHMTGSDPNPNATSEQVVARVHALAAGQDRVIVACDSGRSWRHDVDATYKGNRPERDESLIHQQNLAIDQLSHDGFVVLSVKGQEADDILATVASQGIALGHDVIIATADKDLLQLVSEHITVKSVKTGDMLDVAAVEAKVGVTPSQVQDFLTLTGDSADDIVGAKGIGPKTAVALLKQFGTLDDLYAVIDSGVPLTTVKPAALASLKEFRERMPTVRKLIGLNFDVPVDLAELLATEPKHEDMEIPVEEPTVKEAEVVEPIAPETPELTQPSMAAKPAATTHAKRPDVADVTTGELVPWERGLEPRNMDDAARLSKIIHDSRQFLGAYGTPQAVMASILAGRELGLPAMASLRGLHIVEGKPTMAADLMRALVMRSGLATYFRCTSRTNEAATFVTKRGDDPEISLTYSVDDAKQAGLVKAGGGWVKNSADMCCARASAKLARLVYPEVLFGIYAPEEFER